MGFFSLVVICCLLAAAGYYGKPWVDRHLLLHRENHPKKREEDTVLTSCCVEEGVDIIVQPGSVKRDHDRGDERAKPQAPVASALPSRLARQQLGSPLNVEASIRTALRELRSRQVVKTICSKFESRLAKTGFGSQETEEEKEADTEGYQVRGIQYQPLLSRQEETKPDVSPVCAAPAPRHSTGGTTLTAARSNNLNAFLRRYSSNLDKAVKATEAALTSTLASECTAKDRDDATNEVTTTGVTILAIPSVSIAPPTRDTRESEDDDAALDIDSELSEPIVPPPRRMSAPLLNLRLDIDPTATITADGSSNQCDDAVVAEDDEYGEDEEEESFISFAESVNSTRSDNNSNDQTSPPSSLKSMASVSRIPMPNGARSLSRSSFSGELGCKLKVQTPEKTIASVNRLQLFRQQVPGNSSHLD